MEAVIKLRPATPADLELLQEWDEQAHVIASDPNSDWRWEVELGRNPDWREQLIAELDGRPIGFLQIIDPEREESHYWGDVAANLRAIDIWIGSESDLGKGYGTKMMALALARCFDDPSVSAVLIDPLASNTRAHRFYERIGFRFLERRRFGDDECLVYRSTVQTTYKPPKSCKWSTVKVTSGYSTPEQNQLGGEAMNEKVSRSEYLVISRGQWDKELSPEEIQKAIDQFYVWLERLVEEGKMKTGQRLGSEGKTVSRKNIVTDGPFGEAKEVIGGYWFIIAGSLDEAAQIAAGNPCLNCGLFFEIRPIDPERASAFTVTTETPIENRR